MTNLYEGFLQRGPDAGGLSFWTAQAGTTAQARQNVLNAFATSDPFRELSGTLYRETFWMVSDHLGTPRMVVDRSGNLVGMKQHDYLPFGEELLAGTGGRTTTQGYGASDNVRQKFTKQERDAETGLDYFVARYYSNAQGRFTGVDPMNYQAMRDISDPQSWNAYAYVNNNPLRRIDPNGMAGSDFWEKLGNLLSGNGWNTNKEAQEAAAKAEAEAQAREQAARNYLYQLSEGYGACGFVFITNDSGQKNAVAIDSLTREEATRLAALYKMAEAGIDTEGQVGTISRDAANTLLQAATSVGGSGAPRRIGDYGYEGSAPVREAVNEVSGPGTHETVGGRVPSRAEAEGLINRAGGRIDRIERGHTSGAGHPYDHINYTTADGQKATVRVESVGRQFYRDARPKN